MLVEAKVIDDLPPTYSREIGRIIVKFASLENKLTLAIYVVMQVHKAEGRLAIRDPRAPEKLDLLMDLLALREVPVKTDAKELRKSLEEANNRRDQLAHSIWVRDPASNLPCIRITKGNWPLDQQADGRKKRAVLPEGAPISITMLKAVLGIIEKAAKAIDGLGAEIDRALATSPQKFQSLLQSRNPLLGNMPIEH